MEWALVTHIRGRRRAVVSEGQELRGRQAPRKNGAFSATFCRSLERCAAPMFVMTWVGGVITPTLSIGPKSVGGLNHNPVGAFRCQCSEERAMDDPFKQTRDPRMRAERYQGLAWEYYDLAKQASSPSQRAYWGRIAEEYLMRAQGELRVLDRSGA